MNRLSRSDVEYQLAHVAQPFVNKLFTPKVRAELAKVLQLRLVELELDREYTIDPKVDSMGILRLGLRPRGAQ